MFLLKQHCCVVFSALFFRHHRHHLGANIEGSLERSEKYALLYWIKHRARRWTPVTVFWLGNLFAVSLFHHLVFIYFSQSIRFFQLLKWSPLNFLPKVILVIKVGKKCNLWSFFLPYWVGIDWMVWGLCFAIGRSHVTVRLSRQ